MQARPSCPAWEGSGNEHGRLQPSQLSHCAQSFWIRSASGRGHAAAGALLLLFSAPRTKSWMDVLRGESGSVLYHKNPDGENIQTKVTQLLLSPAILGFAKVCFVGVSLSVSSARAPDASTSPCVEEGTGVRRHGQQVAEIRWGGCGVRHGRRSRHCCLPGPGTVSAPP